MNIKQKRPLSLENAPMQFAPKNELGVVFLFAAVAKKLQFRIVEIKPSFPDCIAYKRSGTEEELVRIEFEYKSRNFLSHKHNPDNCDCIVCWEHDWPETPVEVIELKRYFGVSFKVWIQPVVKEQYESLEEGNEIEWGLSKRATPGDLLLMYKCSPLKLIEDVFVLTDEDFITEEAGWRIGKAHFGIIKRLCRLKSPIHLDDFRNHRILKTSSFIRSNMQGNKHVSSYWNYIYDLIKERNPDIIKKLSKFTPDKI